MKLTAFATWGLWDSNPIFFRDPNKKTLRFYFALRGGRGQGSPLFKHYLLATPLTEKEDVVSCLSAFSLSFFLTVANSRSFVCPSLRPPFYFIVVVGPSALLDLFIRHVPFQWKKTRYMLPKKQEQIRCINSLPARFERKNSSLHNSQSYSISKDPPSSLFPP